jgi:hypothetical protein
MSRPSDSRPETARSQFMTSNRSKRPRRTIRRVSIICAGVAALVVLSSTRQTPSEQSSAAETNILPQASTGRPALATPLSKPPVTPTAFPDTPPPAEAFTISQLQILQDASQGITNRLKAAEQLGKSRNPEAFAPFIAILSNKTEHALLRCYAARGLGSLADERAVEALGGILADASDDTNLRAASALALGGIKTESAVVTLAKAKGDANDLVRFKVIQGLERTGQGSAITHATDALDDPDVYTRARAIHALGGLGATSTLPKIKALLEDPETDNFTRIACLTSLGDFGGKEATAILQKYQNDQNKLLRINANRALQRINEKEPQ